MQEDKNTKLDAQKDKKEPPSSRGLIDPEKGLGNFKKPQFQFSFWYFFAGLVLLMIIQNLFSASPSSTTIEYSEFKKKIEAEVIQRVEMETNLYTGYPLKRQHIQDNFVNPGSGVGDTTTRPQVFRAVPIQDPSLIQLMDEKGVEYYTKPTSFFSLLAQFALTWILPIVVMVLIWRFLFTRMSGMGGMGGVMSFGKNHAQLIGEGETGVTFDDVAGADEAKEELKEVVDFLKHPERYEAIGGRVPTGLLLVGPPGTGKTLLAKAVAGEAHVPFFKISGADFVELFVGVGAARVRDLFKQAREKSPCIIFIDELDAIGKSRANNMASNDEREQTLNQLLVEMDGFDARGRVVILAATNRPEVLDKALLRPGRFDRQVLVDHPDFIGRKAILKVHSKNVKLNGKVDLEKVAKATVGFSGADLANLVNEASLLAVRGGRTSVSQKDFDNAFEKVIAGLERKTRVINPREKEIVAYHESGHALMAALSPDSEPVQKISIVPRGLGALGYTLQLPTEDRFLTTEKELMSKIDVLLGGRAAEEVIFNEVSSGAANDLSRATEIVRKMIMEYGMSEKFRNVVFSTHGVAFLGEGGGLKQKDFSETTQNYIDTTIAEIIQSRYAFVLQTLQTKKSLLEKVSRRLLEVETMDASEFQELIKEPLQAA